MDDSTNEKDGKKKISKYAWERRRFFRKHLTPTEARMWTKLRNKRFHGYTWIRQYHIDGYFLDFYCIIAKLAIELDGAVHDDPERKKHDEERTRKLEQLGIKVLRFKNASILYGWPKVEAIILAELKERCPNP